MPQVTGLVRERLWSKVERVWAHRLSLVVAPTGSGKTTLLAHFAARAPTPVAWYEAGRSEASVDRLILQLRTTLASALGCTATWASIEEITDGLEQFDQPILLVVDDLHELEATAAERELERLINLAPPSLTILGASRRPPHFNLSRLRIAGALLELDADDLRFRSWEVERLFHEVYRAPLAPEELAELARRTEGWAAGLQLFHLTTKNKSASERRRILHALARRSRLFREYLAENLIDELPAELRHFLVETSVLGRLTGAICDDLLGCQGSEQVLREIERRQIFICPLPNGGAYRYHEALRAHLEAHLVEEQGEGRARDRYRHAGAVLERAGALTEAVDAYSRAQDWSGVTQLLERQGQVVIEGPGAWLEQLPGALVHQDPWLILASARHRVAVGDWRGALAAYEQADRAFGPVPVADVCRRERLAVAAWLDPLAAAPADWTGLLRRAVALDPLAAARDADGLEPPFDSVATATCLLLAGHAREARGVFELLLTEREASVAVLAGARLGAAVAALLSGDEDALDSLHAAHDELEQAGLLWLARLVRGSLTWLTQPSRPAVSDAGSEGRVDANHGSEPWSGAILAAMEAVAAPPQQRGPPDDALVAFRHLGAPVIEAWGRAGMSLAMAHRADHRALAMAQSAATLARRIRVPGAQAIACRALTLVDPVGAPQHGELARALEGECGLDFVNRRGGGDGVIRVHEPPVVIRCFGTFSITLRGGELDLSAIRPRARAVLRLLASRGGQPVHREVLLEAFWPEADERAATRSLQVAISSLRHLLERAGSIVRADETYRLAVTSGAHVDVIFFDAAIQEARTAEAAGDAASAQRAWDRALGLYVGDLLPCDGPAEWVVKERDRYRMAAADAAHRLARTLLDHGEWARSSSTCERGLEIDPYCDGLWRVLVSSLEGAGEVASAARCRLRYQGMLAELGLGAEAGMP